MPVDLKKLKTSESASPSAKKTDGKNGLRDFLNSDIPFFSAKLSDKKKEHFYSELYILLSSGVDSKPALDIICEEEKNKNHQLFFIKIKDAVSNGKHLDEAMAATGQFSPYEITNIEIGRQTGRLNDVLAHLAKYFEGKEKLRRQLFQALSYPAFILLTALGVIIFMMKYVIPSFADLFVMFNVELPYVTRLLMKTSEWVGSYLGISILFITVIVLSLYAIRKKEGFRRYSSNFVLRIPVLGKIIKKVYHARFCYAMHLLISSEVHQITALGLVKNMISFYPVEKSIEHATKKIINEGAKLHECLSLYKFYDKRLISLIRVGNETKQLHTIFGKLAKEYEQEVENQTAFLNSLIEPALILLLGAIVGFIVVAMYLPMLSLGSSLNV